MTGAQLLEIQPGKRLGDIVYRDGESERAVGSLSEGIIPEASVLASRNTHIYIAGSRPKDGEEAEEVIIAIASQGPGNTTIGIDARVQGSEVSVDTNRDLLAGGLQLAMRLSQVATATLEGPADVPDDIAEVFGLARG
jgi:hypothetical protein